MNDTREWTLRISPSGVIQVALVADLSDDLQYVRVIPKAEAERRVQEVETKVTREAATAVAAETKWLRQVQVVDVEDQGLLRRQRLEQPANIQEQLLRDWCAAAIQTLEDGMG